MSIEKGVDTNTPYARSEAARVEAKIRERVGERIEDLRVIIGSTGFIIQGKTDTYHAKQVAQAAAMENCGQFTVEANEIDVS